MTYPIIAFSLLAWEGARRHLHRGGLGFHRCCRRAKTPFRGCKSRRAKNEEAIWWPRSIRPRSVGLPGLDDAEADWRYCSHAHVLLHLLCRRAVSGGLGAERHHTEAQVEHPEAAKSHGARPGTAARPDGRGGLARLPEYEPAVDNDVGHQPGRGFNLTSFNLYMAPRGIPHSQAQWQS